MLRVLTVLYDPIGDPHCLNLSIWAILTRLNFESQFLHRKCWDRRTARKDRRNKPHFLFICIQIQRALPVLDSCNLAVRERDLIHKSKNMRVQMGKNCHLRRNRIIQFCLLDSQVDTFLNETYKLKKAGAAHTVHVDNLGRIKTRGARLPNVF